MIKAFSRKAYKTHRYVVKPSLGDPRQGVCTSITKPSPRCGASPSYRSVDSRLSKIRSHVMKPRTRQPLKEKITAVIWTRTRRKYGQCWWTAPSLGNLAGSVTNRYNSRYGHRCGSLHSGSSSCFDREAARPDKSIP